LFAGRFTVFSGGKLEFRKGQDLVVRAFAIFAARHPDALLVTAWHSPFPGAAQSLNAESALEPIELLDGGPSLDVIGWAVRNGIPASQFLSIGQVPNGKMPRIYREMDIAVFPNRCEGATNLVAMECMACGVPVILAQNTGQADITAGDRCYVLARQTAVPGPGRDGWGESDVEEIVAALEDAYADPAGRRARAERGAAFMRERSWARTVRERARAIAASL
jgi:glycosyltransferase involved in cell wall biosynthesis